GFGCIAPQKRWGPRRGKVYPLRLDPPLVRGESGSSHNASATMPILSALGIFVLDRNYSRLGPATSKGQSAPTRRTRLLMLGAGCALCTGPAQKSACFLK